MKKYVQDQHFEAVLIHTIVFFQGKYRRNMCKSEKWIIFEDGGTCLFMLSTWKIACNALFTGAT